MKTSRSASGAPDARRGLRVLVLALACLGAAAAGECANKLEAPFLNSSASGFSAGGVFNVQLFSPADSSVLSVDFGDVQGNFSVSPVDECKDQVAIRANWATLAPTLTRTETATDVTFSGLLALALRNPSCDFNPPEHHVPSNVPVCIESKHSSSGSSSSGSKSSSKSSKALLLGGGGDTDSSSDEENSSNICGGSSGSSSDSKSKSSTGSSSGNGLLTGGSLSSSNSKSSSKSSSSDSEGDCVVPTGPGDANIDIVNASCVLGHACFIVENRGPNDMTCKTQYRIKVGGLLARSGGLFLRLGDQTQLCFPVDERVSVVLEVDLPPGANGLSGDDDSDSGSSGDNKSQKKKKDTSNGDGTKVDNDLISYELEAGCAPDPCLTPTHVFPFDVTFPRNIESDVTDLLTLSPVGQIAALVKQSVVVDVNTATAEATVDLEVLLDYPYLPLFTENSTLQVDTNRTGLDSGIGVDVLYTCDDPDPDAPGVNETFCRFKFRFGMTPDGVCDIDGIYDLTFIVVCSPRYLAAGGACDLLTSADNVVDIQFRLDSEQFCSQVVDTADVRASLTGWKSLDDAKTGDESGGAVLFPRSNFLTGQTAFFRVGVTGDATPTDTRLVRLVVSFPNGTQAHAVDDGLGTGVLPDLKLIYPADSTKEMYFSFSFTNPPFSVPSDGSAGFSFKAYVNLDFGSAGGGSLLLASGPAGGASHRPLKGVPALMDLAVYRVRELFREPTVITVPVEAVSAAAAVRDSLLIGLISGAVAIGAFTFIYLGCCSSWRQREAGKSTAGRKSALPLVNIATASKRRSFRESWRDLRQRRRDRRSRKRERSGRSSGGSSTRRDRERDVEREPSSSRRERDRRDDRRGDSSRRNSRDSSGDRTSAVSRAPTAASTRKAPPRLAHRRSSSLALPRSTRDGASSRYGAYHQRTPSGDGAGRHVRRSSRGSAVSSGGSSRRRRRRSRSRSPSPARSSTRDRVTRSSRRRKSHSRSHRDRDNSPSRGSSGSGHSGLSKHSHVSAKSTSRGSSRHSAALSHSIGHHSDAASTVLADFETGSSVSAAAASRYNPSPAAHRAGDPVHRALPSGPYRRVQHPMEPIPVRKPPGYEMAFFTSPGQYDPHAQQEQSHRRAASDHGPNVSFFGLARGVTGYQGGDGGPAAPAVGLQAPPMPAIVPEHQVYATDSPIKRPIPLGRMIGFE